MLEKLKRNNLKRGNAINSTGSEVEIRGELRLPKDKIVVFGARATGAYNAATEFQSYLRSVDPRYEGISVGAVRNIDSIAQILGYESTDRAVSPRLPVGVVIFPEMRTEQGGYRYAVPSPVEYIASLCEESGIPYIVVSDGATSPELVFPGAEVLADRAILEIEAQS